MLRMTIAALLFACSAYLIPATALADCQGNCPQGGVQSQSQSQGQHQRQTQRQSQHQNAVGIGVGQGGQGGNSSTSVNVQGSTYKRSAYAPDVVLAVGNCIGTTGGSLGVLTATGGFGTAEEQKRCTILKAAAYLASWGRRDEAIKLVHGIDWVAEILYPKKHHGKQSANNGDSVIYQDGKRIR